MTRILAQLPQRAPFREEVAFPGAEHLLMLKTSPLISFQPTLQSKQRHSQVTDKETEARSARLVREPRVTQPVRGRGRS